MASTSKAPPRLISRGPIEARDDAAIGNEDGGRPLRG